MGNGQCDGYAGYVLGRSGIQRGDRGVEHFESDERVSHVPRGLRVQPANWAMGHTQGDGHVIHVYSCCRLQPVNWELEYFTRVRH
eukprot:4201891-Amphidinium_carterae.1